MSRPSQYIELRDVAGDRIAVEIKSEPPGARITIDGQPRGTTPATIPNLTAGDHAVVLELAGRKATQAVKIEPGSYRAIDDTDAPSIRRFCIVLRRAVC